MAPMASTQPAPVIELPGPRPVVAKTGKQHLRNQFLVLGAIAAIAIVAWALGEHWSSQLRFETLPVQRGPIQSSVTATGNLNPVVEVQVGSQVSGNIKALYADFNTKVTKGQLVALIDPEIFQAQVNQASAAAASTQAAVVTAEAQVEKAEADLAAANATKSNLQAAEAKDRANFSNAQLQWQRSDQLFGEGVVSEQDHDSARATYDAAQAQLSADESQIDAADHNVESARAGVRVAQTQLRAARAQQQQAEATLAQAKINLAHTRIIAPVSGTVIARHFDVGQTVAASFQAPDIFDIGQDLTKMQVDTNVDESDVGAIRVDQGATFTVDAYPGTVFHGSVADVRKAPINAQNVVTYDVVITAANPDLKLFPGMTANVTIITASQENALKVPNAALRFNASPDLLKRFALPAAQPGTPQIFILSKNKLRPVSLKTGISDGRFTSVESPELNAGDQAVIRVTTQKSADTPTATRRLPGM